MKALEILKLIKEGSFTPYLDESLIKIDEAIEELEEIVKEDVKNAHLFKKVCQDYEAKLEKIQNRSC